MIITISGLPGSGKTTVAKTLAEKLKLRYISTGEAFRKMAEERKMKLNDFSKLAEEDFSIDKELDKRQIELVKEGNVVFEGRLAGWLTVKNGLPSIKIWLSASFEIRAERIMKREGKKLEIVKKEIENREGSEWNRYWNLYGIDLNDLSVYDYIIDTNLLSAEQTVDKIMKTIS